MSAEPEPGVEAWRQERDLAGILTAGRPAGFVRPGEDLPAAGGDGFVTPPGGTVGVMEDPYQLSRFVEAQDPIYPRVLTELRGGRKVSHWMWFVFPQIAGLGSSPAAQRYAIGSLEEARAYLQHPVLGPRLVECAEVLLDDAEHTAEHIFGGIDAVKLRSSMTLFKHADPQERRFARVLDRFFDGAEDSETVRRL